jgi:hypothetical protein
MNKKGNKNIKDQISRKDALSKIGRYVALTAVGTFITLNPRKSQAFSLPPPTANDSIFDD